MKKQDLKSGMIVELRNGTIGIVIADSITTIDRGGQHFDYYNQYLENIAYNIGRDWDIMAVYKPINCHGKSLTNVLTKSKIKYYTPIWQRVIPKEYTIEEIEEKLGEKIKIIF